MHKDSLYFRRVNYNL